MVEGKNGRNLVERCLYYVPKVAPILESYVPHSIPMVTFAKHNTNAIQAFICIIFEHARLPSLPSLFDRFFVFDVKKS